MIVERCWLCLEQPAVAIAELPDGRSYPVCDVCAADQRLETQQVPDDEWADIVQHLR